MKTKAFIIIIPQDLKKGETIHIIIEVSDEAEFPMSRYQRVILEGI